MTMTMKDHLVKFLNENGVYAEFVSNLVDSAASSGTVIDFDQYVAKTFADSYICDAFSWDQGTIGKWSKIDLLWTKYLEESIDKEGDSCMKAMFDAFLHQTGSFDAYYENTNLVSFDVVDMINHRCPEVYIRSSFMWSETAQGSDYWKNIHDQWYDLVAQVFGY